MSVTTAQELKGLQTQRDGLKGELTVLRGQRGAIDDQIKTRQDRLAKVLKQIADIEENSAEFVITEHALLRFLERVDLIDFEQLKQRVLPEDVKDIVRLMGGSGTYPAGTHRIVVKKKSVVTVMEAE